MGPQGLPPPPHWATSRGPQGATEPGLPVVSSFCRVVCALFRQPPGSRPQSPPGPLTRSIPRRSIPRLHRWPLPWLCHKQPACLWLSRECRWRSDISPANFSNCRGHRELSRKPTSFWLQGWAAQPSPWTLLTSKSPSSNLNT